MPRSIAPAIAFILLLLGFLGRANAQTLYGITAGGGDQLITINTVTGAGTPIGPLSSAMFAYGIGFRGNKLYAYDQPAARIRELNPATGATVNTINIAAPGSGEGEIAFRSDGIGFLTNINAPRQLVRFDLTVPSSAVVGPLSQSIDGMAFDSADVLYAIDQLGGNLYTINQTTAALTLVGPTGISKAWPDSLGGLAFDASGNLFMTLTPWPAGPTEFYRVNPTTGTATLIGNVGINTVSGIRFGLPKGVTITESGGSTSVAEGGAADAYTVVLNAAPSANVTITVNSGTQVTVAPATLTFTSANWNVPQTITVTAVDDAIYEGAHVGTIAHTAVSADPSYNGMAIMNVSASIADNDPPPPMPVGPTGNGEGNYQASKGSSGPEGCFGFGGGMARGRAAVLNGPHARGGDVHVFNASHQPSAPDDQSATTQDIGLIVSLALALSAGVILVIRKRT